MNRHRLRLGGGTPGLPSFGVGRLDQLRDTRQLPADGLMFGIPRLHVLADTTGATPARVREDRVAFRCAESAYPAIHFVRGVRDVDHGTLVTTAGLTARDGEAVRSDAKAWSRRGPTDRPHA